MDKPNPFSRLVKLFFWVGSIIKHGGQNPLEAAKYGCQILHGPNIWNFKEIYNLLKVNGASHKVTTPNQLTLKVSKILNNKNNSKKLQLKIKNLSSKILNSTLNEINFYIKKK